MTLVRPASLTPPVGYVRLNAVVRHDGQRTIAFTARRQVEIDDPGGVLCSLLSRFDGFRTFDDIVANPEVSERVAQQVLDCLEARVLVPSSELTTEAHEFGSNPMPFAGTASAAQVVTASTAAAAVLEGLTYVPAYEDQLELLMQDRKSCRSFERVLSLDAVRQVLHASASHALAASPAAGGMRVVTVTALHRRPRDVFDVHRYDPIADTLDLVRAGVGYRTVQHALDSIDVLHNAPVVLVATLDLAPLVHKYSNRGYRFAMLECGHVMEAIALRATANDLTTLEWGAYLDRETLDLVDARAGTVVGSVLALGLPSTVRTTEAALTQAHQRLFLAVDQRPDIEWVTRRHPRLPTGASAQIVLSHLRYERADGVGFASGVGRDSKSADVSAMAEALERGACLGWACDEVAPMSEVTHPVWVPQNRFGQDRLAAVASAGEVHWIHGRGIDGRSWSVPSGAVFFGESGDDYGARAAVPRPSSSGVALHTDPEVARARAFLELVERDAFARAWYGLGPAWSLSQQQWPDWFAQEVERWRPFTDEVRVLHIPGLLPTVVVAILSAGVPALSVGASCGPDLDQAVQKAWLEAAAGHLVHRGSGAPGDVTTPRTPREHALYYADPRRSGAIASFFEAPRGPAPDFGGGVEDALVAADPMFVTLPTAPVGLSAVRAFSRSLTPLDFGPASVPPAGWITDALWRPDRYPHPFP